MNPAAAFETNLTQRQVLIWLEQQLEPGIPANNMVATFVIRAQAPIDGARFRRAFATVVQRSDALRTVFEPTDSGVRQRVRADLEGDLDLLDLGQAADPHAAFRAWFDARRQTTLKLSERAFDSALLYLGDGEWAWYLCLHHLISDAASLAVIYRQTLAAYSGQASQASLPFADYVAYQSQQADTPEHAAAAAFWQRRLAERLPPLRLYGHADPRQTAYSRRRDFTLEPATVAAMRDQELASGSALGSELSLAAVFLTALFAWLHRVSGDRRIGVGMPVQNRPGKGFRGTIGLLMEVVSVRVEVEAADTFASLLAKVRRDLFDALRHSRYCAANPSHRRAHEVMFDFQAATFPGLLGPTRTQLWTGTAAFGARDAPRADARTTIGYPLIVTVHDYEGVGSPTVTMDCNRAVFDEPRADRAATDFARILDAGVREPHRQLRTLPVPAPDQPVAPAAAAIAATEPTSAGSVAGASGFDPPADPHESEVAALWKEVLGVERVGRRDDFFALGGNSPRALGLLQRLRRRYGSDVPLALLFETSVLCEMAAALARQCKPVSGLAPLQPHGRHVPLFLLSGVPIYRQLALRLGAEQPSHGVLLPDEERLFGTRRRFAPGIDRAADLSVESLAAVCLDIVRAAQPHGPYCLGGLSFGGLLAFETAQRLRRAGEHVALVVLFDTWLPRARRRSLLPWTLGHLRRLLTGDMSMVRRVTGGWPGWSQRSNTVAPDRMGPRTSVAECVGEQDEQPPPVRMHRALRAARRYDRHIEPYGGRVLLFRAQDRHEVAGATLVGKYGWEQVVTGRLDVVDVRGDHTSILQPPFVDAVAAHLRAALGEALSVPRRTA